MARKAKMTPAESFFYKHAGYSWDPKTESANDGRRRCAREMARAEEYAQAHDWQYEWSDDWDIGSHTKYYGKGSAYENREPTTCESCLLKDADGEVLAALGCIDDATDEYRRVIEAELASEALGNIEEESREDREQYNYNAL